MQPQPQIIYAPHRQASGMATASLVFGIIGFFGGWCMFGLPCILAVLLGHAARAETKSGVKTGDGAAVAGLILGYIFVLPALVISGFYVFGTLLGIGEQ